MIQPAPAAAMAMARMLRAGRVTKTEHASLMIQAMEIALARPEYTRALIAATLRAAGIRGPSEDAYRALDALIAEYPIEEPS